MYTEFSFIIKQYIIYISYTGHNPRTYTYQARIQVLATQALVSGKNIYLNTVFGDRQFN